MIIVFILSFFYAPSIFAVENDAQCIASTIPSTLTVGESRSVSVTFKNTGTSTWVDNVVNPSSSYVATVWPQVLGGISLTPIAIIFNVQVLSGESKTFTFTLTAPSTTGSYSGAYRMVQQNVAWFGESCGPSSVTVIDYPPPPPAPNPTENKLVWVESGPVTFAPKSFPYDIRVTSVTMNTYFRKGATADYCFSAYRDQIPLYNPRSGGYTEKFCLNILQSGSDGSWERTTDFSANPLYIPANTKFVCNTSAGDTQLNSGQRWCAVTFERYITGDARYQVLRIPYFDAILDPTSLFPTSWYKPTSMFPLRIKGFQLYDAVVGTYTACLQRTDTKTGTVIEEKCVPAKTRNITSNNEPPAFVVADWNILSSETLSARCDVSNVLYPWDCALYAIVEIPHSIIKDPENIFRDYGNISRDRLLSWCTNYIDYTIVASQALQLCDYQTNCGRQTKIDNCMSSYSVASCIASNSCIAPILDTNSCSFNNQAISHGHSVIAYQSSAVPYGSSCISQTRTCTNGVLSGEYSSSQCNVLQNITQNSCLFNNQTIKHGQSVKAYIAPQAFVNAPCESSTRTCNNGSIDGNSSYVYANCTSVSLDKATIPTLTGYVFEKVITKKSSRVEVLQLQKVLNKALPSRKQLVIDGIFGKSTIDAIRAFQRKNSLSPDGVVGKKTRVYLNLIK